jgi:cytoskeletal protein CcmA (bactofilin family)
MAFGSKKKVEKVREYTPYQRQEVVKKDEEVVTAAASYIGKTMKIEGELVSEEDLTIEGDVSGTIEVSKTLTIGGNGSVSADINANVVKIIGRAKGNIVASDKVSILSQGRYTGNIQSQKLVVAEGAILIGDINKETEGEKGAGTEETAEPESAIEPETPETQEESAVVETAESVETVEAEETAESTEPTEAVESLEVDESGETESEESGEKGEEETEETDDSEKTEEADESEEEEKKGKKRKRRRRY